MMKWILLALVAVLQLIAIIGMVGIGFAYGSGHPARMDRWYDLCNQILVYTPTLHAAVGTAMISAARQRGEPVPLMAHISRAQGCILASILWGMMIYAFFFLM